MILHLYYIEITARNKRNRLDRRKEHNRRGYIDKKICATSILLVLEIQRLKSVKACRPIARQATVNANSSANSLKFICSNRRRFAETPQYVFVANKFFVIIHQPYYFLGIIEINC
ncbi:MAG: hypothetical protein LBP59_16705 [Planctomycetaceae bacterium]|nr:hypothetical protein [Planctomycetaceae bacterium]